MNNGSTYLLLRQHGQRYALAIDAVVETVWLPLLTPLADAAPGWRGMFNLRGVAVPVLDISLRLGQAMWPFTETDCVVVVRAGSQRFGLIADAVDDVVTLSESELLLVPEKFGEAPGAHSLFAGELDIDGEMLPVLDIGEFLLPEVLPLHDEAEHPAVVLVEDHGLDVLFRQRAHSLARRSDEEGGELLPLGLITLSGEHFAVGLDQISEFTRAQHVTPIPCCPRHIIGNVNFRGNLLTLLDIRSMLNITGSALGTDTWAIVLAREELRVGIAVDAIDDLIYLPQNRLLPVPAAGSEGTPLAHSAQGHCLIRGLVHYEERVLPVLDLHGIATQADWVVNDNISARG